MNIQPALDKRARDHLSRSVRYNGRIMTYEQMANQLVSEGYTPERTTQQPSMVVQEERKRKYKNYIQDHYVIPRLTNPNAPEAIRAKKLKEDITKGNEVHQAVLPDGIFVSISKTQYDLMTSH